MVWRSMFCSLFFQYDNVELTTLLQQTYNHIKSKKTKQTLSLFCNGIISPLFTSQESLVKTTMPEDNGF